MAKKSKLERAVSRKPKRPALPAIVDNDTGQLVNGLPAGADNKLPAMRGINGFTVQLTESHLARIEELCSKGAAAAYVAYSIGVSVQELERVRLNCEALDAAISKGVAQDEYIVGTAIRDQAIKGNVIAGIYYTKSKHGWRDKEASNSQILQIIQVNTGIQRD